MRLGAERFGAGGAGGVEHEGGCPAGGELGDTAERVGVSQCAFELGLEDRVDVSWFVAAGVTDGLLALGVGPAGAVGDQLAVVATRAACPDRARARRRARRSRERSAHSASDPCAAALVAAVRETLMALCLWPLAG